MLNWGSALYNLTVVGTFFLAYALLNKRTWMQHPAFVAYIVFCGIRSLVLHPLFRTDHYGQQFWYWQLAALPILGAAIGELFKQKLAGAVAGAGAALASGLLMMEAAGLVASGNSSAAMTQGLLSIDVIRYAGIALAVISLCAVRGIGGIASGLTVATMFSSLSLLARGNLRFSGTAAWIVALFLWMDWVRTYRESALKPPNHAHGKRYGRRVYGQIQRQALGFLNTSH